jgi:ATP-dependent protease ClpP protease subunit
MSDDESQAPEPGNILNNMFKKENEIKVDGNKVFFYKGVTRDNVLELISVLRTTIKKISRATEQLGGSEKIPVYLFINCEGGDYFAGLSAMDHIKSMDYPIYTVIDGMVASAGTFISLAGTKRFIMKSSWVLIHQIKSWFGGTYYTYEQLRDEMENSDNIMKNLNKMYLENTKIPPKKLNDFFKRDLYLDSKSAIELGIVDGIYNENVSNKKRKRNNI